MEKPNKKLKNISFKLIEKTPSPSNKDLSKKYPDLKLKNVLSFSKENSNNINIVKNNNIKKNNTHEITTTHDETISKFSNSQNIKIKSNIMKKRGSFKNRKREREKIFKLFQNNEKIKIPIGQRKSNANKSLQLNINNIDNIVKQLNLENKNNSCNNIKQRKDYFGNIINKNNKKKVHISFKDLNNNKLLVDYIPIQSFKSFNYIDKNEDKILQQPFFSRCCAIF